MSTVCDTANGWTWSESSCGCVAVGCTTGDISKQKVEDCGTSGSNGWTYRYEGMSGGKKCGICEKKPCDGNSTVDLSKTNPNYSCTNCWYGDTQKFTCTCNLTDALCGAGKKVDMSTCTCKSCEDNCSKHGWTDNSSTCGYGSTTQSKICNIQCYSCNECTDSCSNHSGWVSSCTKGCDGNYKVTCTNKTDDCGGRCYVKNEEYCTYGCTNGECNSCTDTCAAHGWVESCSPSCKSTSFTPPENPSVTATKTECSYMGKICGKKCYQETVTTGDGWWGSICCSDSDCKASSELALFCFSGRCYECASGSDCNATNSPYQSKYGSNGFYRGESDTGPFRSSMQSYEWVVTRYSLKYACCDGECISDYCQWCKDTHGSSATCYEK